MTDAIFTGDENHRCICDVPQHQAVMISTTDHIEYRKLQFFCTFMQEFSDARTADVRCIVIQLFQLIGNTAVPCDFINLFLQCLDQVILILCRDGADIDGEIRLPRNDICCARVQFHRADCSRDVFTI